MQFTSNFELFDLHVVLVNSFLFVTHVKLKLFYHESGVNECVHEKLNNKPTNRVVIPHGWLEFNDREI